MMIYGRSGQAPKPFLHLFTHYEMSPHDNNKIRIVIFIYFFLESNPLCSVHQQTYVKGFPYHPEYFAASNIVL